MKKEGHSRYLYHLRDWRSGTTTTRCIKKNWKRKNGRNLKRRKCEKSPAVSSWLQQINALTKISIIWMTHTRDGVIDSASLSRPVWQCRVLCPPREVRFPNRQSPPGWLQARHHLRNWSWNSTWKRNKIILNTKQENMIQPAIKDILVVSFFGKTRLFELLQRDSLSGNSTTVWYRLIAKGEGHYCTLCWSCAATFAWHCWKKQIEIDF